MVVDRFTPLRLRTGPMLQNRIVVPPMASATATPAGFASPSTIKHYERLAESGAGLIFVEYSHVHPSGKSEPNQLGAFSDKLLPGLRQIARACRSHGARVGLQLVHSGGKTTRDLTGGVLMGPSPVAVPVKDQNLEIMDPMDDTEIQLWKDAFLDAAGRAAQAGFDAVEFHAAHGYGLSQWLSPITNRRTDSYGGDLMGRARLLLELVSETRARHPGLLVSVRFPGQDFLEDGLALEDSFQLASLLEARGADFLHISSGIGGWRRPGSRDGEGYFVDEARAIQARVGIPVIGVGGIKTGAFVDRALAQGDLTLAAVGRAILEDPSSWRGGHLSPPPLPLPAQLDTLRITVA